MAYAHAQSGNNKRTRVHRPWIFRVPASIRKNCHYQYLSILFAFKTNLSHWSIYHSRLCTFSKTISEDNKKKLLNWYGQNGKAPFRIINPFILYISWLQFKNCISSNNEYAWFGWNVDLPPRNQCVGITTVSLLVFSSFSTQHKRTSFSVFTIELWNHCIFWPHTVRTCLCIRFYSDAVQHFHSIHSVALFRTNSKCV